MTKTAQRGLHQASLTHLAVSAEQARLLNLHRNLEEWRGATIANRVCAFDWTDTVQIDPANRYVFEADYTLGRRDRTDITYTGI